MRINSVTFPATNDWLSQEIQMDSPWSLESVENLMKKVWTWPGESILVGLMILGKISARLEHFATHKWLFP